MLIKANKSHHKLKVIVLPIKFTFSPFSISKQNTCLVHHLYKAAVACTEFKMPKVISPLHCVWAVKYAFHLCKSSLKNQSHMLLFDFLSARVYSSIVHSNIGIFLITFGWCNNLKPLTVTTLPIKFTSSHSSDLKQNTCVMHHQDKAAVAYTEFKLPKVISPLHCMWAVYYVCFYL